MATRSKAKAYKAIDDIRKAEPASTGSLMFLFLDLADFIAIKTSVQQFLAAERKLHVLFNNAGIMAAREETAKTVQGHEIHLGVNCLGTFLFTKLLTPILLATAADTAEVPNTVRVVWVSSFAAELFAATGVGIPVDNLDYHVDKSVMYKYAISKTGSWAYGVEFAKRYKAAGIISIPLSPGFLHSGLFRHQGFALSLLCWMFARPAVNGAYTQLFAGLSSKVTIDISGSWVVPSGRVYPIRADLNAATRKAADVVEWLAKGKLSFREPENQRLRAIFEYLNPFVATADAHISHDTVRKGAIAEYEKYRGTVVEAWGLVHHQRNVNQLNMRSRLINSTEERLIKQSTHSIHA
ncbi:Retinol dehydrogenase 12 [Purpureocillium lavendulum]|uniref:Retinol dehydrogenase 12 n=1 Tax=Purpureocillium lavendulum TaxID=1247861 RepID=A0AB34FEQ5_9HYPO|nr:Retinol dehydrogenase 12 [Purpureocillium lavendulum]